MHRVANAAALPRAADGNRMQANDRQFVSKAVVRQAARGDEQGVGVEGEGRIVTVEMGAPGSAPVRRAPSSIRMRGLETRFCTNCILVDAKSVGPGQRVVVARPSGEDDVAAEPGCVLRGLAADRARAIYDDAALGERGGAAQNIIGGAYELLIQPADVGEVANGAAGGQHGQIGRQGRDGPGIGLLTEPQLDGGRGEPGAAEGDEIGVAPGERRFGHLWFADDADADDGNADRFAYRTGQRQALALRHPDRFDIAVDTFVAAG